MNDTIKKNSVFRSPYGISLGLLLVAVIIYVVLSLPGCSKSKGQIKNVVLISIDTCRPDYLSCYGYPRKTTPNIDACAEDGIIFKNAVTPIPLTLPAHTSMLTGTIPPYHGVRDNGYRVSNSNVTLAEILKKNGFVTGAVVGAFVMDSQFALDQGFDNYNDRFLKGHRESDFSYNERKGQEVTHFANNWLQEHREQKFFLFIHYFDPHFVYEAPDPFGSEFSKAPYAGEVAYVDYCIGEVIEKLKDLGLYDSTLLIITSDHGESLGEHSEHTHGYFIYQSTLRVPLVFKVPGASKGKKIDDIVGLIDIVPTVCDLLDVSVPSQIQGTSIKASFYSQDTTLDKRSFYCESLSPRKYNINPLFGLVNDHWKYIHTLKSELYDIKNDPRENQNLISQQAKEARTMKDQLEQILAESTRKDAAEAESMLDEESRRRLESLGYISGGKLDGRFQFDPNKGTAKDSIKLYNAYSEVMRLHVDEKYHEARKVCEEILAKWPDTLYTYFLLGSIAFRQGDDATVIRYLSPVLENFGKLKSDSFDLNLLENEYFTACNNLGRALFRRGMSDRAIATYKKALSYDNDHLAKTYYSLGNAYLEYGSLNDAVACYNKAIEIDPDLTKAHCNLAHALVKLGKSDEAIKRYRKALTLSGEEELTLLIYESLAKVFAQQKNFDQAISYWSKLVKVKPDEPDVLNDMGIVFFHQGKLDKAVESWSKSLRLNPDQAKVHNWLANVSASRGSIAETVAHWQQSLKIDSNQPNLHNKLATVFYQKKQFDDAFTHWTSALSMEPDHPGILNSLAWMKATNEGSNFYDPQEAVELAQLACELTEYKQPSILDTLSVAYAAAGRFDEAIKTARKAVSLATSANQPQLAEEIESHLRLFEAGRPYLENATIAK